LSLPLVRGRLECGTAVTAAYSSQFSCSYELAQLLVFSHLIYREHFAMNYDRDSKIEQSRSEETFGQVL
jgi:hypothetical protein